MSETTLQKIGRKTGTKPNDCKCNVCKSQCTAVPGLGTPEDIINIINAGIADRIAVTIWQAGIRMGITNKEVEILAPIYDETKGACTFFTNGLCELHPLGLKPTECRLSSHNRTLTNFDPRKALSWTVVKEWFAITEDQVKQIEELFL